MLLRLVSSLRITTAAFAESRKMNKLASADLVILVSVTALLHKSDSINQSGPPCFQRAEAWNSYNG